MKFNPHSLGESGNGNQAGRTSEVQMIHIFQMIKKLHIVLKLIRTLIHKIFINVCSTGHEMTGKKPEQTMKSSGHFAKNMPENQLNN